jgi:hypothetical protein
MTAFPVALLGFGPIEDLVLLVILGGFVLLLGALYSRRKYIERSLKKKTASAKGEGKPVPGLDWSPAPRLRYEVVREIGTGLLVAAVTVMIVDRSVSAHQIKIVEEVAGLTLPNLLKGKVGQRVADELSKQVIGKQIQYSDFETVGILASRKDLTGDEYFECSLTTSLIVTNTGSETVAWTCGGVLNGIRPGRNVRFTELRLERRENGADSTELDYDETRLSKELRINGSEASLRVEVQLEPGSAYLFTTKKTVGLDQTDQYYMRTGFVCDGMRLKFTYPAELVEFYGGFLHPANGATDTKDIDENGLARIELDSVALPHQGAYFEWRPRE